MAPRDEHNPPSYIPCRTENFHQDTDWERSWRLARLPGLDSEQITFLWRLLHRLLPTLERVNRFNQNTSSICKHCNDQVIEGLPHALISREITQSLMDTVGLSQPISSMSKVLTLDFEMEEKLEFPMVWLIKVKNGYKEMREKQEANLNGLEARSYLAEMEKGTMLKLCSNV